MITHKWWQFDLGYGAKMIKHSAIKIWSRIPLEIKNKTCLALFSEEYKK